MLSSPLQPVLTSPLQPVVGEIRRGSSPRPVSFGALGDSITRNEYSPDVRGGTGNFYRWTARAWGAWTCQLLGRKAWANIYAFEGYSGYRTDEILAGMLPASSTYDIGPSGSTQAIALGVLACRPDYCFEMSGTNDLSQSVPMATAVANRQAIWAALRAAGIEPIAISLLPRDAPAPFAADVPTWNAAMEAAAVADGVQWIDVYTNCDNGSGGFKSGWTYTAGAADATGLHPGNEACQQMASDIAAALSSTLAGRVETPYVDSDTTYVFNAGSRDLATNLGGGVFASATGWGKRFEPGPQSSVTVSAAAPAQEGNALVISYPATASDAYFDRNGPDDYAITPGARYGLMLRLSFEAGHKNDNLSVGLQGAANVGQLFWSIDTNDQNASTAAGAGMVERDIYHEFTAPPTITSTRLWVQVNLAAGSTGATLKLAQLGLRAL